ncbi:MAG TPA: TerB family tellurite resistance protein [Myxococcales bacterium]|nr:TerB family tellurite resistance protein [Myxococcales bacterium]
MADKDAARRIYELMVLTAWADGRVEASEALAVHEVVTADPAFKDLGGKGDISRAVKARIDAQGLDATLKQTAAGLTAREDRELAFRCCARVLDADGDIAAEEADALASLQELFGLSGDDVKRLMRAR